jgi:TetR/AcrR family transcriptional regulator
VGTPLPEQLRRFALEALRNPDGVRLLSWNGLEYKGSDAHPSTGMFAKPSTSCGNGKRPAN